MNIFEFSKEFPDESSCKLRFKLEREKEGVVCKKCCKTDHYWLKSKQMYQCKHCRFRMSLRSGTVMENSKLPFSVWFAAIMLMSSTKKAFSALEVQRQLGLKRYEPVWLMMHKLRRAMGNRDSKYLLEDELEVDDAFIPAVKYDPTKESKKRGRGSQKQSKIIVIAESKLAISPKKNQKSYVCGRFKMVCVPNLEAETANEAVSGKVSETASVRSDNSTQWAKLKKIVAEHDPKTLPGKEATKVLPWVHTGIANVKRQLLGIYHMVSDKYLQNYLDEFCYKLNRRYFEGFRFDRLLVAATYHWSE